MTTRDGVEYTPGMPLWWQSQYPVYDTRVVDGKVEGNWPWPTHHYATTFQPVSTFSSKPPTSLEWYLIVAASILRGNIYRLQMRK